MGIHTGSMEALFHDFQCVKPTFLSSTPHIYTELYQTYRVERELLSKRNLSAVEHQEALAQLSRRTFMRLGGHLEVLGTGGAHTSPAVLQFMEEVLRAPSSNGYGATEVGSICTIGGAPFEGIELKLLDTPDMGYFVNPPDERESGGLQCVVVGPEAASGNKGGWKAQGEVLVKSALSSGGYFNDSENTVKSFDDEGFWHTGDIGELQDNGTLRLIDRKKFIFKLSQGKFVAPEKVESILLQCQEVHQVLVYGDPLYSFLVALVVPHRTAVASILGRSKWDLTSEELSASDKELVSRELLEALQAKGKEERLEPLEIPRQVLLCLEPFTAENGLLSSTLKTKRLAVEQKFKYELQALYEEPLFEVCLEEIHVEEGASSGGDEELDKIVALLDSLEMGVHVRCRTALQSVAGISLAMDSLAAVRLLNMARLSFGIELKMAWIMQNPTIGDMCSLLLPGWAPLPGEVDVWPSLRSSEERRRSELERMQDDLCMLDMSEDVSDCQCVGGNAVLVTGVTGFIGQVILLHLMEKTQRGVVCIVRQGKGETAENRVEGIVTKLGLPVTETMERITVIAGDLSCSSLILTDAVMARVSLMIHCGAQVNSMLPYSALRDSNVAGTVALLQVAKRHRHVAHFHFVSTLGVWGAAAGDHCESEHPLTTGAHLYPLNGYSQSKLVAEALVWKAASKYSLSVSVSRPGMVGGHSTLPLANKGDFFNRLLLGFSDLGCYFPDCQIYDVTPVDYVAAVIAEVAIAHETVQESSDGPDSSLPSSVHFTNRPGSSSLAQLGFYVSTHRSTTVLEEVPYEDFRARLLAAGESSALHPLVAYFSDSGCCVDSGVVQATAVASMFPSLGAPPPINEAYVHHLLDTFL